MNLKIGRETKATIKKIFTLLIVNRKLSVKQIASVEYRRNFPFTEKQHAVPLEDICYS